MVKTSRLYASGQTPPGSGSPAWTSGEPSSVYNQPVQGLTPQPGVTWTIEGFSFQSGLAASAAGTMNAMTLTSVTINVKLGGLLIATITPQQTGYDAESADYGTYQVQGLVTPPSPVMAQAGDSFSFDATVIFTAQEGGGTSGNWGFSNSLFNQLYGAALTVTGTKTSGR